jgi:hypothetical protein
MTLMDQFRGERLTVGCTVEIDHAPDRFGAHVHLDGEPPIHPGDRIRVTGGPIEVRPGSRLVLRRTAEIRRATPLMRLWTRISGHFEMLELAETSFTDRRLS